ncbi:MAG: MBOAT family protein, partial [Moorea sp. SIO2B7]|nr:MBOAT family protein [Moorena sp. SIO2B7]
LNQIILPLAISFFTFQQIAYLVDAYRGETKEYNFLSYCLFVSFFPQLIAGPIVHHKEVMSQFADKSIYRFDPEDMAVGVTIFSMGLFKKVLIADSIAAYATPVFDAAAGGVSIMFLDAWVGALAYTLQLYFDFSGYSDMAIGVARMFGIKLPINFNSPYKAVNISDFWRRWHITLSNFLRDYLYIPLGGNRKGEFRRNFNLVITMLLGGLWHGAGWNFVFWGGLHGVYLIINHQWRSFRKSIGHDLKKSHWWSRGFGCIVTFLAVVVAWVFFRAENMKAAFAVLKGMIGANGVLLPSFLSKKLVFLQDFGVNFDNAMPILKITTYSDVVNLFILISSLLLIVWFIPNTQQWMAQHKPAFDTSMVERPASIWKKLQWEPGYFSIITGVLLFLSIKIIFAAPDTEFLYFDF